MSQRRRLQNPQIRRQFLCQRHSQSPRINRGSNPLHSRGTAVLQGLGQQIRQQQNLDTAAAQQLGELVVLILCARYPRQPVEQQLVVVARVQPTQFVAWAVQDNDPQCSHLGIGPQLDTHSSNRSGAGLAGRVTRQAIELMCDKLANVAIAVQGSLFEHNERRQLGDGAFIDVRANWLRGGDDLLGALLKTVPWRAERRQMYERVVDVPRLVSFHDLAVEDPPHPELTRLRRRLNDIYGGELGEPFTTVGLCCYRDGSDSVAWHGDTIGRSSSQDTMVAIVSLGDTRTFAMRRRGGGPSLRLPLAHGDLLVMGGSCQRTWEHSVPKTTSAVGPRVSIQFRPHDVR